MEGTTHWRPHLNRSQENHSVDLLTLDAFLWRLAVKSLFSKGMD